MIVCFDLNGTLTDVRALTGDDRGIAVFDAALMLVMAESLSGSVRPLPDYFRAVLEREWPDLAEAALERLPRLPAQPGAAEALGILRDAGRRVAVVTNSATEAGEASLRAAGLRDLVDAVVGADGLGVYKPDPRVYANAARALGAEPRELCLVAAHAWDVQGAMRAGWHGAWVGHTEHRLVATLDAPLASGPTLVDVARRLAQSSGSTR